MVDETQVKCSDVPRLNQILEAYGAVTGHPWFSFTVSRNQTALEGVVKAIKQAQQPSERETELEKAKQTLLVEYARKDKRGNPVTQPIMTDDGTQIVRYALDNPEEFNEAFQAMVAADYPDVEDITKKRVEKYVELMDSEVAVSFTPLKASEIPKELLKGNDLVILFRYNIVEWDLQRDVKLPTQAAKPEVADA